MTFELQKQDVKIEPFIKRLISEIIKLVRNTGAPARTVALAASTHTPESTIRYWLRKAEDAGHIQRRGKRGGWLATPSSAAAVVVPPSFSARPSSFAYLHA